MLGDEEQEAEYPLSGSLRTYVTRCVLLRKNFGGPLGNARCLFLLCPRTPMSSCGSHFEDSTHRVDHIACEVVELAAHWAKSHVDHACVLLSLRPIGLRTLSHGLSVSVDAINCVTPLRLRTLYTACDVVELADPVRLWQHTLSRTCDHLFTQVHVRPIMGNVYISSTPVC